MTTPSATNHRKVVIIGSGPAGYTAAVYTARANLSPLLIHGPLPGGQLTTTTDVENYPGFPEGIMGPELMQLMEKQALRFGTEIKVGFVTSVERNGSSFICKTDKESFTTDTVILATGATAKLTGAKGEKELMGYGVSTCATCDGAFFREKIIVVVGGGDSACEEASFLTRFGKKVYLIHRRDKLRASKIMQQRVLNNPKIEMVWNATVAEVHGTKETGVTKLTLLDTVTNKTREHPCDGLFVAIGHVPNSSLVRSMVTCDENGYVVTKPNSTATDVPGLFVCGDVQDHVYRQAVTAAGSGCMAAIEAERWLEGHSG